MNLDDKQHHKLYNNRFLAGKRISAGSFGVVYVCQDIQTKDYVAMKVEKEDLNCPCLDREIEMLEQLQKIPGIPTLIWAGNENNQNCVVMQLLGRDLSYHLKALKRFTLKSVVNIALQVLQIIEGVHRKGIIHRDMKPENVMTGRDQDQCAIYLADFGIAKFYREKDGTHVPFKENKPFVGTTRYASIGAHKGYELSRRDDLESIGYMLIYMYKGTLPWQTVHNISEKEKTRLVGLIKIQITIEELCKNCPLEFYQYFQYIRSLEYRSTPDYRYLYGLFEQIATVNGFKRDKRFDWTEFSQGTTFDPSYGDTKQGQKQTTKEQRTKISNASEIAMKNDRNRSRHQSEQYKNSSNGSKNSGSSSFLYSQQSSILLNYQNSQFSASNLKIGSSKLLNKLQDRGLLHKSSGGSKGSLVQQQSSNSSRSFRERHLSQQQPIFLQQESLLTNQMFHLGQQAFAQDEFQDLEELEEKLKKDKLKIQRSNRNRVPMSVKKVSDSKQQSLKSQGILKQQIVPEQTQQTDMTGMTTLDEESLESKLQNYNYNFKFKQNLAKY